jgi:hypothetical protein
VAKILGHDAAEVDLGRPVGRAVVVGQVKVGDAEVEGAAQDGARDPQRPVVTEVLPQAQRDRGQLQAAATAAAVLDVLVAVRVRRVDRGRAGFGVQGHGSQYFS